MWFEPLTTWLVSLISQAPFFLKEKTTKSIPAEYWANKELYHKDLMAGVSAKERLRRAEAGRYYIPKEVFQAYPIPHRDPENNKIVIENCSLYDEDLFNHGAVLTQKWVKQGKYNLNKYESEIETLRLERKYAILYEDQTKLQKIDAILATKKIDWHNTEAVRQWKQAYAAESKYH